MGGGGRSRATVGLHTGALVGEAARMLAARRSGRTVDGAHRRNVAELKSTRKQRRRAQGRYRGSGGATGQEAMQTDGKRQGLKRAGAGRHGTTAGRGRTIGSERRLVYRDAWQAWPLQRLCQREVVQRSRGQGCGHSGHEWAGCQWARLEGRCARVGRQSLPTEDCRCDCN